MTNATSNSLRWLQNVGYTRKHKHVKSDDTRGQPGCFCTFTACWPIARLSVHFFQPIAPKTSAIDHHLQGREGSTCKEEEGHWNHNQVCSCQEEQELKSASDIDLLCKIDVKLAP